MNIFPVIRPIIPKAALFSRLPCSFFATILIWPRARLFFRQHEAHNDDGVQSKTDANRKHIDEIFDIFLCFFTLFLSSHPKQVRVVFLFKVEFLFSVHSKS